MLTGSQLHICDSCGSENLRHLLYCAQCWYPLSIAVVNPRHQMSAAPSGSPVATADLAGRAEHCTSCGRDNPHGQRYCLECWTPLTVAGPTVIDAVPAPVPAQPLEAATPEPAPVLLPVQDAAYGPDERAISFVVVTIAFTVAVFVRFYGLGDIPSGLHAAEDVVRRAALAFPGQAWPAFWSDSAIGRPPGLVYLAAGWVRVLGETAMGLRLLPAVIGLATLALFFAFCRSLFGIRAATLGTLLMAFSMWHLSYSRLLVPAGLAPLFVLLVGYLLYLAWQERHDVRRRRLWLVVAGISFAAGLYCHSVFLFFGAAVLALWARELLAAERPIGSTVRSGLAFFIPALVLALPFLVVLGIEWEEFASRWSSTLVFGTAEYQDLPGIPEETRYLVRSLGTGVGALLWRPTTADEAATIPRFVDPITALLTLAGLLTALWRWRDRRYFFLLVILAVGVATAAFTAGEEQYGRLGVALPAVFALAGLALDGALTWLKGRLSDRAALATVGATLAIVIVYNVSSYYRAPARYAGPVGGPSQEIRPAVLYWVSGSYLTPWEVATSDSAVSEAQHRF